MNHPPHLDLADAVVAEVELLQIGARLEMGAGDERMRRFISEEVSGSTWMGRMKGRG
jgi:hypothetical protein